MLSQKSYFRLGQARNIMLRQVRKVILGQVRLKFLDKVKTVRVSQGQNCQVRLDFNEIGQVGLDKIWLAQLSVGQVTVRLYRLGYSQTRQVRFIIFRLGQFSFLVGLGNIYVKFRFSLGQVRLRLSQVWVRLVQITFRLRQVP